jgi:hypothetical protein
MEMQTRPRRVLGEILVQRGQARLYQINFLAQYQQSLLSKGVRIKLGELLLKHRVVTAGSLEMALNAQDLESFESVTEVIKAYEGQISQLTIVPT